MIYDSNFPIVLSIKTSLRERYKQADLEGLALKQVHRRAKSYLITLSEEGNSINQKIKKGDILGLDECFIADTNEFNQFIQNINKNVHPIIPEKIDILKGNIIK